MFSRGRNLDQREEKIEPIQNLEHRRIVFSKCKRGLFKKAAELSILCGADTAIVVFSPQGNTVYSFGSPSVNSIINRFLNQNPDQVDAQDFLHEASGHEVALRRELHEVENQLKAEKKREKLLNVVHQKSEDYINGLISWDELQQMKGKLEGLKRDVEARAEELQKEAAEAAAAAPSSSMSDANGPPAEETDDETDIYH